MKTLRFTIAAVLTGEKVADFLASKPVLILLIIAAAGAWYYAIRSSSTDENSTTPNSGDI